MKSYDRLDAAFMRAYRASALTTQGGCCVYCLAPLPKRAATADHRRPRAAGGGDHQSNIHAACADCNRAKGRMSEASFLAAIKGDKSVPFHLLKVRMYRRIWQATHASCKRIMASVGGQYHGPKRKAA